jgi:hypothetical protein
MLLKANFVLLPLGCRASFYVLWQYKDMQANRKKEGPILIFLKEEDQIESHP